MKNPVPKVVVLSLSLLMSRSGWAGDAASDGAPGATTSAPRPKFSDEALALYKARDYRHAAETFLQAYSLEHDPNLLFNIARCYEAMGDAEGAIEKYTAFLDAPDADVEGKRRATLAIRTLRQAVVAAPKPAALTPGPGPDPDLDLAATGRTHAGSTPEERFTLLSSEGLALYKAGEYRRSGEKFLQAYAIDPDPNLLFNVARCYAATGDTAAAIEKYETFLRAPGTDVNGRTHAEANLRRLRPAPIARRPATDDHDNGFVESHADRTRTVAGWTATALLTVGTVVTGILALESASKLKTARDAFPSDGADIANRAARTTTLTHTADALGLGSILMGGLSLYWTLRDPSTPTSSELKVGIGSRSLRIAGSF